MKLKDICIIQSGGTPSRSKKEYWENGTIPWVKISDFSAKHIINTQESITEQGMNCSSAKLFPKGTLLYTIFATIGEVGILDIDATTNQAIVGIMIKNSMVDQEYLYYYLMSLKDYVNRIGRGVAQNNINMSILRELEIPLPPIEKQKKISNIFIQLDKMIEQRQNQIDLIDELVKSRFIEMFDGEYPEETLFNLCNIIDYRGKTPEKADSGLPFITAKNVKMHHMALEPREYISKETYDKVMVRGFPKEGDVVFTTEAPLGNVCRIPHFDTEFYIGQRIVTMQTEELNPIYLEYALSAEEFVRKYMRKSSGSTVKGIRVRLLEQLTIPVPLRVLQDDFANFVLQTDKSKYYNFTSYKYCVLAANLIRQEWMLCQTLSF